MAAAGRPVDGIAFPLTLDNNNNKHASYRLNYLSPSVVSDANQLGTASLFGGFLAPFPRFNFLEMGR